MKLPIKCFIISVLKDLVFIPICIFIGCVLMLIIFWIGLGILYFTPLTLPEFNIVGVLGAGIVPLLILCFFHYIWMAIRGIINYFKETWENCKYNNRYNN